MQACIYRDNLSRWVENFARCNFAKLCNSDFLMTDISFPIRITHVRDARPVSSKSWKAAATRAVQAWTWTAKIWAMGISTSWPTTWVNFIIKPEIIDNYPLERYKCKHYVMQPMLSSQRVDRERDIIEMIMGLSNTYTNQQLNTNQQPGGGNRNYVLGGRRRSNWSRTPQDGRRTSRYLSKILRTIGVAYSDVILKNC